MDNYRLSIIEWAIKTHNDVNQKYNGEPYSFHLESVANNVRIFGENEFSTEVYENLIVSAYCHDLIEDARITYGDLKSKAGEYIADIVYLLTDELGKTRRERILRTYPMISEVREARFLKCCDVLANTNFSKITGHSMYKKYKSEYPIFRAIIRVEGEFSELWSNLDAVNEFR